jgi:hypothetical protein
MQELINLPIGIIALVLGVPIGNFLARMTKEELELGRRWFKLIIIVCLAGGFISLALGNDVMMFTFFFMAIVTSRSLKK